MCVIFGGNDLVYYCYYYFYDYYYYQYDYHDYYYYYDYYDYCDYHYDYYCGPFASLVSLLFVSYACQVLKRLCFVSGYVFASLP